MAKRKSVRIYFIALLGILITGCHSGLKSIYTNKAGKARWDPETPYNTEEFRAAWIATVANINWPGAPGLPVDIQKQEAIKLLDFLEQHHFNAVIFQVRPQADALYNSSLEPWSYYLTGKQGEAPYPFYDPLEFWIEEAHKRGLELHAWLNPYRAHHTQGDVISDKSVIRTDKELVVELDNGMWWMDPGLKGTQDHSLAVVMDIVKRYDVDGIHFDDYFYPYDSYHNGKDFPDDVSWRQYRESGGKLSRNDWRRENVNRFIKRVYGAIKQEKPFVKFGLSPFGIWRPGHPESVSGYDQYDKLFADARLWLNKGWIDYFSPQLYWSINKAGQSFPELLGWWQGENTYNKHLWPGIKDDLGGGIANADEVVNQVMITRGMVPQSKGVIHWNVAPLMKYDTVTEALMNGPYKNKALVPASPWLDNTPPDQPVIDLSDKGDTISVSWTHSDEKDIFKWVVYYQYQNENWQHSILTGPDRNHALKKLSEHGNRLHKIGITAVDRSGNQSKFFTKTVHN
ncbi:glycoside hydrolase family 10 protein [Sinomicrobium sp. M5D2P9]